MKIFLCSLLKKMLLQNDQVKSEKKTIITNY